MSRRMGMWAFRMQKTYAPSIRTAERPCLRSSLQPRFHAYNQRSFSQTSSFYLPRKDSQDRNSINTEATEYSKSGTDDQAAKQDDAAFDPSKTSPEEQKATAGKGNENESNPLDVSPANPEVSKQRPEQEGGAEKSAKKESSGGGRGGSGSPNKGKEIK